MGRLGELYHPGGKALEHARAVLEVETPHACNVAWGCSLGCSYCYGPRFSRQSRLDWRKVRYPREDPVDLVRKQLARNSVVDGAEVEGVFISFMTEPYLPQVRRLTEPLIKYLLERGVRVATSSKLEVSGIRNVRNGMTIVSLDRRFWETYELNTPSPSARFYKLYSANQRGDYTWASIEPCPCKGIFEQDIHDLLIPLNFVDLMVLGMWNYDERARTEEAREDYRGIVGTFRDFCKGHGIRHHVKSGTLEFIEGGM